MAKMMTPIQKWLIPPSPTNSNLILPLHKTEFPPIPKKMQFRDFLYQKVTFQDHSIPKYGIFKALHNMNGVFETPNTNKWHFQVPPPTHKRQ